MATSQINDNSLHLNGNVPSIHQVLQSPARILSTTVKMALRVIHQALQLHTTLRSSTNRRCECRDNKVFPKPRNTYQVCNPMQKCSGHLHDLLVFENFSYQKLFRLTKLKQSNNESRKLQKRRKRVEKARGNLL